MSTSENTVQSPAKSKPADSVKDEPSDCEDPNKDAGHIVPPRSEEVKSDGDCESTSGASNVPTVCSNEAKTDKDEDAKAEDEEIVSDKLPSLAHDEAISSTTSAAETECKEVAANSADVSTEPGAIQAQTGSGDNNASEVVCSSSQQNSPATSESEPQFDGNTVVEAAPMDSPPQKTMSETRDQSAVEGDMDASSPPRSVEDDFEGSDEDSLSDEDEDIHVGRLRRRSSVSEEEEEVDDDDYEEDFTDEGDYSEEESEDEEEEEEEGEEEVAESEFDNQAPTDDGQCDESTGKRAEELSPSAHTVTFSAAIDAAEKEGRIVDENKSDSREQKAKEEEEEEEENKKNPAYVPRSGAYYMHDVRNDDSVSDGEGNAAQNTTKRADRRPGIMADRWQHDRFDARLQAPPTEKELIYRYGYNIRKHGFDEVPDSTPPAAEATTTSGAPDVSTGFSSKSETSRPRRVPRKKIPQGRAARSSGSGGYRNIPVGSASSDPIQASAEQQPKLDTREAENTRSRGCREGNRSDRGKDLEVYPSAPRSDNVRGSFTRSSATENSCQVQGATSNQRTRTRQMDTYDEHRAPPPRYNRGPDSRRELPSEEHYERDDFNHIASRDEIHRRPVDRHTDSRTPPGRDRREDRRHVQRSDVARDDRRTSHDGNYRAHPNNNRAVGPLRNQNYHRHNSGGGEDVSAKTRGNAVLQSSTDRHMDYYDDYCAPPSQHQGSDPRCDQRYAQRSYASTNFRDEPDDYQGHSGRRLNQPVRFEDEIRHGSGYRQDRHQPLAQASSQPSDDRKSGGYRPGRYGSRGQPSELKKPHRYSENSYRDYDQGSDLRPERYQPRAFTSEVIESSQASGRLGYQDRSAGRGFNAGGTGRHSGNRSSDFQSGRRFRHGRAEEQVQVPTQRAKRYSTIRQTPNSSGPSGQELEADGHHRPLPQASPSPADRLPPPVTQKTIPPEPQSTVTTTSPPKPTVTSAPTPDSTPSTGQTSNSASKASPSTTPGASKDMQLLTSSMNAVRLGQPTHSVTYSPVGLGGSFPGPVGAQFAAGDPEMPPIEYYRSIDPALVAAVLNQQHALAQAVNNAALNGGPPLTPPHSLPAQAATPPSSMGGFPMSPGGDAYYGVATMPVDARQLYNVPPPLVGGAPPFRPELQPTSAATIPGGRPILGNRPKRSLEVKDPSSAATLTGTTTPPSSSQVKAV